MSLLNLIAIIFSLLLGPALADGHGVVNVYSARHYDSDVQLYEKFTAKTGIKVNVVSGKSGALEKRIIEEGGGTQIFTLLLMQEDVELSKLKECCKLDYLLMLLNQQFQKILEHQVG